MSVCVYTHAHRVYHLRYFCISYQVRTMARDLYDDHFKAVESMPRGVVVTLRNIATQLESSWELHTNRQASFISEMKY